MKKELVVFLLVIVGVVIFMKISHRDIPKTPAVHKHVGGCCGGH